MKSHLERMFDSVRWADERMVRALVECPAAQGEALPLLAHLLAAEQVWLARLEQRAAKSAVWPTINIQECEALARENAAGYRAYVDSLSEASLLEKVSYHNQSGQAFSTAVVDILTHVVIHGAYHRGQIAKMLGRAGMTAPATDYIVYVRDLGE